MDSVFRAALAFLERDQAASGRFRSWASFERELAGPCVEDETPFVTAFVAPALQGLPGDAPKALRERALSYLIACSEPPGVWRYWRTGTTVLDPDLDDTACASSAVGNRHFSVLCGANRPLILGNRDPEGRFKTWLRSPERPNDVDSVVNANVVGYLGESSETEAAIAWLLELVAEGRVEGSSWYYPLTAPSLAYCMARAVRAGVSRWRAGGPGLLASLMARRQADGSFGSVLETALTITAAVGFGLEEREVLEPAARSLLQAQAPDGSWPRLAFYSGPEPPGPHSVYFGSEALTTVLCLEALVAAGVF